MPFPGLRSSGDQVLGERTVPGELCLLITSLVPAAQSPAISGVPRVSSRELTSGCGPPGRCQPARMPGRLG